MSSHIKSFNLTSFSYIPKLQSHFRPKIEYHRHGSFGNAYKTAENASFGTENKILSVSCMAVVLLLYFDLIYCFKIIVVIFSTLNYAVFLWFKLFYMCLPFERKTVLRYHVIGSLSQEDVVNHTVFSCIGRYKT